MALFAAIATTAAPAAAQQGAPGNGTPMAVGVDLVRTESMKQTVPVIGRFVPRQAGAVAARVAGPIAAFEVEIGDRVARGDLLAVMVRDTFKWRVDARRAEVRRYDAEIRTTEARVKLLMQEVERLFNLKKSPAFSQARLDDKRQEAAVARSEVAEARGRLATARADLSLAELELGYTEIRAPYPGVVTQRHSEVGAYVRRGDPLVNLVDDSSLEIEADVPAGRVGGLVPGTEIPARMILGKALTARVRAVVPQENPQTRTRVVRFTISQTPEIGRLAANQSVTLRVPAGAAAAVLTVHKDAVLKRQGGSLVYVVADGKAAVRRVSLGEAVGSRFIVRAGLRAGDLAVVRGNERLRPGQPVDAKTPPAAATEAKGRTEG